MKINQIISDLVFSSLSIELLGKWFVLLACGFSKRFFLWRTQKTWHWNRKTNTRSVTHRILERKKIELPKKQSFGIGFVILWQIQVEKKADFLRYWKRARYEKQSRGIQKTRRKSGKGEREDLCKRIEALEQFMKGNRLLPNDSNTRKNITKKVFGWYYRQHTDADVSFPIERKEWNDEMNAFLEHRMGKTTQGSIALTVLDEYKKNGTEKLDLRCLNKWRKRKGFWHTLMFFEQGEDWKHRILGCWMKNWRGTQHWRN